MQLFTRRALIITLSAVALVSVKAQDNPFLITFGNATLDEADRFMAVFYHGVGGVPQPTDGGADFKVYTNPDAATLANVCPSVSNATTLYDFALGTDLDNELEIIGATNSSLSFNFAGIEESSPFYHGPDTFTSNTTGASFQFCVRFSMYNEYDIGAGPVLEEVQFREVAVNVDISLEGGFRTMNAVEVTAEAAAQDSDDTLEFTVTAQICDDFDLTGALVLNSDTELPLCFVSDSYPDANVQSLEDLILTERDDTDTVLNLQPIIVGGSVPASLDSFIGNSGAAETCAAPLNTAGQCIQHRVKVWTMFNSPGGTFLDIEGSALMELGATGGGAGRKLLVRAGITLDRQLETKLGAINKATVDIPRVTEEEEPVVFAESGSVKVASSTLGMAAIAVAATAFLG